jgi:uncharacterized protein (TIGR02453 family)
MAFRGWPAEAIEFFDRLEVDNSKAFWTEHKDVYERAVRAPMQALLDELAPTHGAGRIYRPYRDVRFSKDKTPYKTNIAAHVGEAGYVSLSAAGLAAGSGRYQLAPDQLDRYRRAVADDAAGPALEAVLAELRRAGHEATTHGALKTAPKGYDRDHPRIELLRAKGLTAWHQWEPAKWLSTARAKDRIVAVLDAAVPLNRWLDEHVGPSTMEDGGRR